MNPKNKFNMLPHLSFDIQVEIIKKLPIKSLIQFRSVCKAWKSLIDSSQFIVGYNDHHDLPQHLVVSYLAGRYVEANEVKYVSFVDDDAFPQQIFALTVHPLVQAKADITYILSSSNGLLFLVGDYWKNDPIFVVIWNPAIRKSIAVAVPNPVVHKWFDFVVGFGVCPDTKDPKLVKMTYIRDLREMESISDIPCQVMVFTLSSGEWTSICSSNLPRKSIAFSWFQTVVGRFIYWLAYDGLIAEDGETWFRNLIISFDMSTEEYLIVSRLRESLALVEYSDVGYGTDSWKGVCAVWMMVHGDFTKLYTIDVPNASVSQTLGFTKSGEAIVEIEYDSTFQLIVYEPHQGSCDLCIRISIPWEFIHRIAASARL